MSKRSRTRIESAQPTGKFYPLIKLKVDGFYRRILRDQVTPWAFLNTEHGATVVNFHGKRITPKGLAFSGSLQEIYWNNYIEPFVEDFARTYFQEIAEHAFRGESDLSPHVFEAAALLKLATRKIFEEMAELECRLVKPGFPDYSTIRSIEPKVEPLSESIDGIASATIASYPQHVRKWRVERLFEKRPFIPWLVSMAMALTAIAISIFH